MRYTARRAQCALAAAILQLLVGVCAAASDSVTVGGEFSYKVQPGDFLTKIGARYGVAPEVIARENGIDDPDFILAGMKLAIDNRHLIPPHRGDGIIINVPQRLLFLFQRGALVVYYPVGLGRADWPTPLGQFRIARKEQEKPWCVPPSIQEEMREKGMEVLDVVPPGPDNPLGEYWLGLDKGGVGIHGTIAPASVYDFRSHGCIRLHADDVADLYPRVAEGTRVRIIYEPVLLGLGEDGQIFAEVNPDIYERSVELANVLRQKLVERGVDRYVDWGKFEDLLRLRDGIARPIGSTSP